MTVDLDTAFSQSFDRSLERFGFSAGKGGALICRTIMFSELEHLLARVGTADRTRQDYCQAVVQDNCLDKRSEKNRSLTFHHLADLYSLDTSHAVFRALAYFWDRDPDARSLLAALCVCTRDAHFRHSANRILGLPQGAPSLRKVLEDDIEQQFPRRFSQATRQSLAQNINASWTQAGYLQGKINKTRVLVKASAGTAAYALLLGHLAGVRGEMLLRTPFARMLDCFPAQTIHLAQEASYQGWINYKQIGNIVEIQFPRLLTSKEQEWLCE